MAKNTQLPSSALYTEKPHEAASWPMNNQRETPALCFDRHCLRTWTPSVINRTMELNQPRTSTAFNVPAS